MPVGRREVDSGQSGREVSSPSTTPPPSSHRQSRRFVEDLSPVSQVASSRHPWVRDTRLPGTGEPFVECRELGCPRPLFVNAKKTGVEGYNVL